MNISRKNIPEVYLDTNVAYDIVACRHPFCDEAEFVVELALKKKIRLSLSSATVATMIYLAWGPHAIRRPEAAIWRLISLCSITSSSQSVIFGALHSLFRDKEDAFQYFTAVDFKANYFLTRDLNDFDTASSLLPVLTPAEFERVLSEHTIFAK